TDGDGIGNNSDTDDDNDGVADTNDAFPLDSEETLDTDNDGIGDNSDTDVDGDGVDNDYDMDFPGNENLADENTNGIADIGETDTDGDGVIDALDAFPSDPNETADSDSDGVGDNADAFPNDNSETADSDGDGVGDNADAFPNDANKQESNVGLLLNGSSAISSWTDSERLDLQSYIDGLYTDAASFAAIQASIEFLEWVLTDRDIIDGDDLSASPYTQDGGFKSPDEIDWDLPQVKNFLGILTEMHLIGDSTAENKSLVQGFLNGLIESGELSNALDETDGDTIASFGSLIDDLVGDMRGRVNDQESNRDTDIGDVLSQNTQTIEDVKIRALLGHSNTMEGTISGSDQHIDEVDLTIIASGRDTIISDDLTIQTPESAKEDAFVIAAADELYLRDEWNDDTHSSSYSDPDM
ncbi:MAG: hypothetical protein EB157_06230, partial [Euryarchaeota archaeon]|nr:hypothetical protein [Euryarchaeota archaeon]